MPTSTVYPMVQAYLTMYAFSIDTQNPQYKGPFNAPLSFARVFTPDDSAFVTPNSDTPYTFLSLDLRAEPIGPHHSSGREESLLGLPDDGPL